MHHQLLKVISVFVLAEACTFGQTTPSTLGPAAKPALQFEVASVKPAGPLNPQAIMAGKMNIGMKVDKAMVSIGSMSVAELVQIAYKVKSYQLSGPAWLRQDRFNIQAKLPDGATEKDVPEMLQGLLVERFQMTFHRETKDQPVFALVVGKGGHKMKDAPPEPEAPKTEEATQDAPKPAPPPGKGEMVFNTGGATVRMNGDMQGKGMVVSGGPQGKMRMTMVEGKMRMEAEKVSMTMFAEMLSPFVDRPVVDMTGLTGNYQIALDLAMEDMMKVARRAGVNVQAPGGPAVGADSARPADAASDPSGGSIFQSVQQLGLKLDPRKSPLEFIVVDKIEKAPTEN